MSRLRLVLPDGAAGEPSAVETAAVAALTAALANGMLRGFLIYETVDGIGRMPIEAGIATLRGLVVMTLDELESE